MVLSHVQRREMLASHMHLALCCLLSIVLLSPGFTLASDVHVLFSTENPDQGPFPSNLFTVDDTTHNTGRRINLPSPNCDDFPSDCVDVASLNALDGFNLQTRLSIPFSAPIDVNTVTSETIFLVRMNDTVAQGTANNQVIGINQVVWDPETNTLHVESDSFLYQHTRYGFIITNGVLDEAGDPIEPAGFFDALAERVAQDNELAMYNERLQEALAAAVAAGTAGDNIAAASTFTTQSVTAQLEQIRDQVKAETPEAAVFTLGPESERTVFPLDTVTSINFNRQVGTDVENPESFTESPLNLEALDLAPGAVGAIAFGKYASPDYRTDDQMIPPVGTRAGMPAVQDTNELYFTLFLPSGDQPAAGWPVIIWGHGGGGIHKDFVAPLVAATPAASGLALIAINVVGYGGGAQGTHTVQRTDGSTVTFPSGGRGIDQNGDGQISGSEGFSAARPQTIIGSRDGRRQTVVDLMQLVRVIEVGMDVDSDGTSDLDPDRIYYAGESNGGMYGTVLLAVEPNVRAGVANVPGGSVVEFLRMSPVNRVFNGVNLAAREPSLINVGGESGLEYNENMPLRDQPPVINDVPGAMAIQRYIERREWIEQSSDAVAYAPHLRQRPLAGVPAKPVIIQFARGDQTVPNPSTSNLVRAGGLADRTTYYRHDLAFADPERNPTGEELPKNPHIFIAPRTPAMEDIILGAQQQIAIFLASDGQEIIDPDGADGPLFEVPIAGPLPEDFGFIE